MVALSGQVAKASDTPRVRYFYKAVDESVASSTTYQDDDTIVIPLTAGRTYRVELHGMCTGAAAADIKVLWAVAGGAVMNGFRLCHGPQVATADVTATSARMLAQGDVSGATYGVDGTSTTAFYESMVFECTTSGADGSATMRWAQFVSSATATVMKAGTFAIATEIDLQ